MTEPTNEEPSMAEILRRIRTQYAEECSREQEEKAAGSRPVSKLELPQGI